MRSDRCDDIRLDLSAYIDGELDGSRSEAVAEHLGTCRACSAEEATLRSVRKLVRVHPVERVPDLADAIMQRVGGSSQVLRPARERFRIAAVAAAASALIVIGSTVPFDTTGTGIANASEISDGVRAAARNLDSYEATLQIVEHGWHPRVAVREMTATVRFEAPESISIEIDDETSYPSKGWPRNDVTLVAGPDRWWIEEPSSCPVSALPGCAAPAGWAGIVERRRVVDRQPFDGTTSLPTDIVIPLQTLTASDGFRVLGRTQVLGRDAYRLALVERDAVPLIGALQPGGSWRGFHPLDPVDVWIDAQTWFPLRYRVRAGTAPDRALWAQRHGLNDRPGATLLEVTTLSLSEEPVDPSAFDAPASGIASKGDFRDGPVASSLQPGVTAGLEPYRSGRTPYQQIASFTDGMTYLKVIASRGTPTANDLRIAEEVQGPNGFSYYFPATETLGRHVEMFSGERTFQVYSNLPRATLLEVAGSLPVTGRRVPDLVRKDGGLIVQRVAPSEALAAFGEEAAILPRGYLPASATRTNVAGIETLALYLRRPQAEFDGLGIRLTRSTGVDFLPPSSEEFVAVSVGGNEARWSAERGELEWIDGGVYLAVLVPSYDLSTALDIARAMK